MYLLIYGDWPVEELQLTVYFMAPIHKASIGFSTGSWTTISQKIISMF